MNQQTLMFTVILLCNKFENWTIDVVSRLHFITYFVPVTVQNDLFYFTQIPVMREFQGNQTCIYSLLYLSSICLYYKNKIIGNVGEPHTVGKNCDKRQYY